MAGKTVLILGGGWGGMALAYSLRGMLSSEHRVVVIEKNETFALCLSNLKIMTGGWNSPADAQRQMSKMSREGIEWVHEEALKIDPVTREVQTETQTLQGDYLVVALGASLNPGAVPGFDEAAHNLYEATGAHQLQKALKEFDGGKIAVVISRMPYRCPAAPFEASFLMDSMFRERGIREQVEITVYTPGPRPMAVAGPIVGDALLGMLAEREIGYGGDHVVSSIDPESRTMLFGDEEVSYDLLVGVPPHIAPQIVIDSGLTDSSGYIPTHPQSLEVLTDVENLETEYTGVYAIGDVTTITLLNMMPLPKAGVFAEAEAGVVAENIAADIAGKPASQSFDGRGQCHVEIGGGMAALAGGNFFASPGPRINLDTPSAQYFREKGEYENVLDTWFVR
ncbi:MAG: FAD/NAD(P)-binding oxidoreductase [SAR202 cluster bacterium]|nr:FAD/NAD(P)-binding oxidoreductase [SAR202 cluster bacterium]